MEAAVKREVSMLERRYLTQKGAYLMICFVDLLRLGKGFMVDAAVFRNHIWKESDGNLAHVVIPFMGRFKGRLGSDITYRPS